MIIWCESDGHSVVLCYPQHTHAPYWPRLHNMGGWTVAIHTPLSVMAPSATLNVMRVSGWGEHQLWHATIQAAGIRIYPTASVSAQNYFKLTSFFLAVQVLKQVILCAFHTSAVQCEAIHALPLALSMNCSNPLGNFSFGSQCLFTCEEGFSLNGTKVLSCSSTGFWSDSLPKCTGKLLFVNMLTCWYVHNFDRTSEEAN